ncbi:MAG: hypothetical protein KKC20_24990 [Proteobacteria bacterium]|nr:hypothetical protein [Pseudomonadota bacterium]
MQKKRSPIIPIVIAVVIGLAVIVLLRTVIKPTPVVVAKAAIAPGTALTEDLVEIRTLPAGGIPADAFATIEEVVGKSVVVGRATGDFIVASILGDNVAAGIPSQLEAGHVAIAINVDKSSGVAGILRAGQTVTVIGLLTPDVLQEQNGITTAAQTIITNDGSVSTIEGEPVYGKTPTPAPALGPLGRVTITGVRVLLVPQTFQYAEIPAGADQQEMFASQATTSEDKSVIVLDIPTTPVEISAGVFVNPATLIAALDKYGSIYLALESSTGTSVSQENNLTINLAELYHLINSKTNTVSATPTK